MAIFNDNDTSPNGTTTSAQHVKAESSTTISRKMHAQLRLNAHLMAESRNDLAVELAKTPDLSPQEMMDKIVQVQSVAKRAEDLSSTYDNSLSGDLTSEDVDAMKVMANRYGQKITAKCFGISQPAVSDHLSGKTKPPKK